MYVHVAKLIQMYVYTHALVNKWSLQIDLTCHLRPFSTQPRVNTLQIFWYMIHILIFMLLWYLSVLTYIRMNFSKSCSQGKRRCVWHWCNSWWWTLFFFLIQVCHTSTKLFVATNNVLLVIMFTLYINSCMYHMPLTYMYLCTYVLH